MADVSFFPVDTMLLELGKKNRAFMAIKEAVKVPEAPVSLETWSALREIEDLASLLSVTFPSVEASDIAKDPRVLSMLTMASVPELSASIRV